MRFFLLSCLALLTLSSLAAASPTVPAAEATLFARPLAMNRLADDPWAGGIWIASEAGLFFKDMAGGGLRHYGYAEGLDHNKVRDLHVGPDRVWMATGGGVSVLDKGSQAIVPVTLAGMRFGASVQSIFVDARGAWIGTDSQGLFRADVQTLAAEAVPNPVTGQPFTEVIAGLGSSGSELFISATGYGLVIWDRATGEASVKSQVYVQPKPLFGRILVTPEEVWIGTQGDGVVRLARSNGWTTSEFSSPDTTGAMTVYRPILVGNAVYMPTMSGAARYDRGTQSWRDWLNPEIGGSANDLVLHDGLVYAATNFGDVRRYDRARDAWDPVQWWEPGRMLAQNTVRSCDRDGALLAFGTMGGGANYYDPAAGTWTQAGDFPGERGKPDNVAIHAIDSAGGIRYYGLSKGVSEVDTATGEYRHYYTDGRAGDGRGQNPIVDIAAEPADAWFATTAAMQPKPRPASPEIWNPGGLGHLDRSTMAVERFGKAAGLPDENLTAVAVTAERVFVGTRTAGLQVFDRAARTFQPVPGVQLVNDLVLDGGTLWVAAAEDGLVQVDPQSLAVTRVPGWPGGPALSLLPHEGTLWVGTVFAGLHAYRDGAWSSVHSGRAIDALAFCMLADRGTLYLATGWGIERLDLATQAFLPQLAGAADAQGAAGQAAGLGAPPEIAIAGLQDTAGALLVTGSAKGAGAVKVEVSWDAGPWTTAEGLGAWRASFGRPASAGTAVVVARLLDGQGLVLAQTGLAVDWPAASPSGPAQEPPAGFPFLTHSPVLDVEAGLPLLFTLGTDGSPVEATLELVRPDGSVASVPFEAESGRWLVAHVAAFEAAGEASYRIVATANGASRTFPEPFSSYGDRYGIAVHAYQGDVQAQVVARGPLATRPGGSSEGAFIVNNVGNVPFSLDLAFEGDAAAWVQGAPAKVSVPPGESTTVQFSIHAPAGGKGAADLKVLLRSGGATVATQAFELQSEAEQAANGSPGAQVPVLLGLVAVAAWLRRR